MNILYCGDKGIEKGLTMSLLSLINNCNEPLDVYVMTMNYEHKGKQVREISDACIENLAKLLEGNKGRIRKIDCSSLFAAEPPVANMDTRFTPCCMLRLFADLLPEIPDRILYLDYDAISMKNPSELYDMDLDGLEFIAVKDYYGRVFYTPFTNKYFNSGVLLLNMAKIRETGLFAKCRKLCATKRMFLPDQHALNRTYVARKLVDRRYNDQRSTHDDTIFRHFSTTWRFWPYVHTVTVKPWDEEKMHKLLKEYNFDNLINQFKILYHE